MPVLTDRPVDNWWTPARVRSMLSRYPELCLAVDGLRAQELKPYESHASPPGEARFCMALQCKADLDRTIASLPPRLRRVAELRWQEQADPLDIGNELRVRERQAWYLVSDAEEAITKKLCGGLQ